MKRLLKNKNFITIIGIIILAIATLLLSGCNKQIIDMDYSYNKVICNYDNSFTLEIKSWKDYDGEQIQIKSKDGKTYLLSMNQCYLIKE